MPDTAPTTTQQSKPRAANPRILQRTERLLEEGPAAVGVALKSQKYVGKTDEHGPKMVPKPLQNRSWRGSGGHLGATLETRCFQDFIFDDFGSILGPPLGPVWGHFGHHFLIFFRSGFLMALASIWAPKTHSK